MFNIHCQQINIQPNCLSNQITVAGSCNSILINKELSTLQLDGHNCSLNSSSSINYFQINGHNNDINCLGPIGDLIVNGHNCRVILGCQCRQLIVNGNNNTIFCPSVQLGARSNGFCNKINGIMNMPHNNQMNYTIMQQPQVPPIYNPYPNMSYVNNRNQNPIINHNNNNSGPARHSNANNSQPLNQNNNNEIMNEQRRKQMLEIRKDVINNLKECLYKNISKEIKANQQIESECSICLEKFQSNDKLLLFNCDFHYFHKKCIINWLKNSHCCPLCNHHIMDGILEPGEELKM